MELAPIPGNDACSYVARCIPPRVILVLERIAANLRLLGEAMQHTDLIIFLGLGSSLIAPTLYKSLSSIQGLFSRHCYRDRLKELVEHSRLGKMLTRRNIDLQFYLFNQSSPDIENQICACECCDNVDECDFFLKNNQVDNNIALPFCRINSAILYVKDQQEKLYRLRNKNL